MSDDLLARFESVHRRFGAEARREKKRLLRALGEKGSVSIDELPELASALEFVRAYPDDEEVLSRASEVIQGLRARVQTAGAEDATELEDSGVPGSTCRYAYSYAVLDRLTRRFPGSLEVDWENFEDQGRLGSVLELGFTAPEGEANEYWPYAWSDWIARTGSRRRGSDLGFLLELLARSNRSSLEQAALFEMCDIPIRYSLNEPGTAKGETTISDTRPAFQRGDVPKERFELRPEILRPLGLPRPLSPVRGAEVIDACTAALASRLLEIHPLIYASTADVLLVPFERGVSIVLAGVLPEHRAPLGASYFFLVLKNGVPVAYGPAAPLFGACELGINVFPEFRGGEIRYFYAQFMRLLHHALGVELFYLTRYGMGEDNPDAIASGAFWFYRKLGFVPTNPAVERLARDEETRMQADPKYRSDRKMLRRLSHTEAVLDLSGGRRRPFDFGGLGLRVSEAIAARYDGDRERAVGKASANALKALAVRDFTRWTADERASLGRLAPILELIPELAGLRGADRDRLVRIVRGKGSRSETEATRLLAAHARFEALLRAVVGG